MANDKTSYHEAQVIDRVFDNAVPDGAIDGCYVALWASSPSNTPDTANEVTGGSYSPVHVPASDWSVTSTESPRRYENSVAVQYGKLDTSSNVTINGVVLFDGSDTSTANALYSDDLTGGETVVNAGDKFEIEPGNITAEED